VSFEERFHPYSYRKKEGFSKEGEAISAEVFAKWGVVKGAWL
jgi:hypothetical protein